MVSFRGVALLLILLSFLVGCTSISSIQITLTPVPSATSSPPEVVIPTATPFISPTPRLPNVTPTPIPLTQTGPWLVFGESNQEAELLRPWVANSDGSGLRPLSSSASFDWEYQNEWVAVATETSSFDTLSIWRLPTLEPIVEINLERESYLKMERAGWSPAGCYFAFNVSTVDYYGRLKLYSCLDHTISDVDVTHRAFQSVVSWSPDGKWLLYTVESDKDSVRTSPSFLFAYSPQENLQIEIPLEDLGFGYGIEWLSNDEAVISPYPYEGDSWRVDYLSLRANFTKMRVLYQGSFLGIVANPHMREVLLRPYENCSLCDGSQDVNLRIQIDSGEITAFQGDYYGGNNLPWRRDIGIVKDDHWAFISNKDQVISTYTPVQNSVAPQSSSDGAMILFPDAQNIHGSLLTTIEGETIRVLGNIKYATWLPNESIFLVLEPAGASQRLVRYGAATDWQAEVLIPHLGKFYSIGVITPKS